MSSFEERWRIATSNSGIDSEKICEFTWGGKEQIAYIQNIHSIIESDAITKFRPHYYNMSREEMFEFNMARMARLKELAFEGKIPHVDKNNYGFFSMSLNSLFPVSVHHGMFESIVKVLGSDEQVERVWDDIVAYKILGCYAQTEIGHGSDVQSLQTQAIYDETTEEFIIHCPTSKDYKFWPGDLGKMANHAVVFARLMIKGESYGIHAFLIQIRNLDTNAALEGIEIGDIGPKYGYASKDNGYIAFNRVRVSRSSILSRYVNVQKDGNIELKGDPRIGYATMLWIRVQLLTFSWQIKIMAMSSCVRYAMKRTQFKSYSQSNIERPIIDYHASQTKLITILANTYSIIFMSHFCMSMYHRMNEEIKNENFSVMNDLHVLISCLKGYFMNYDIEALLTLRELEGGHGYLNSSSIPGWIEAASANVTLEGDGYVLHQQTTRKLLKNLKNISKGKSVDL
jgi:acyl-CoA oxidase